MTQEERRKRAIELRAAGRSIRQIAAELGCGLATVVRMLNGTFRAERAEHGAERSAERAEHPRSRGQERVPRAERSARNTPSGTGVPRAERPIEKFTHLLTGLKRSGSEWAAKCPAHDDRKQSLTIREGPDGRVLVKCHAGCQTHAIVSALGLRMSDLFAPKQRSGRRIVATYDYRDEAGRLLFQVVRLEPKSFRQRRPSSRGGWVWSLDGMPRVLYRLPELLAADPEQWVFVVEGEKDADRLAALGLVATCNPGGAGKWARLSDDSALHGRRVAIVADKDAPGRKHACDVATRLHGRARDVRVVELPSDAKDISDWLDAGGTAEQLLRLVETAPDTPPPPPEPADQRPDILIDTEEYRVVGETIAALTADPNLYQRGGVLVRVIRDRLPADGIRRSAGSATIQIVPPANLRERMTRFATFSRINDKGEEKPAHPPAWLVGAVDARGEWDGIRDLFGVSDTPILRPDGTVWQKPGYDERTGVLFEPAEGATFPPIHPEVDIDDADAAWNTLTEVVCDFPFESREHQAAWLAALLTPLARFAFTGPAPLFLLDANVRGAGKSLLAQTIGHIVLGRDMPASSYAHDSEEMRKKITALAIAGDRMILLDNLAGPFGNDALDRALTATRWKDRILGRSEEIELPLMPTWYATGNNVEVAADTTRRIIHIRLDCLSERPEERSGFKHEHLLAWIDAHRGRLLSAALTVLSAYLRNGAPKQGLKPFGSFEGWSSVVREAVVWLGLPDPCLTREKLAESADTTADALAQLIAAWRQYDPHGEGVVVADMLRELYPPHHASPPDDGASTAMRAALENVVGCPAGRPPTSRQVSNRLRRFRRRVVDGQFLDYNPREYHRRGRVWRLHRINEEVVYDTQAAGGRARHDLRLSHLNTQPSAPV